MTRYRPLRHFAPRVTHNRTDVNLQPSRVVLWNVYTMEFISGWSSDHVHETLSEPRNVTTILFRLVRVVAGASNPSTILFPTNGLLITQHELDGHVNLFAT